MPSPLLRGPFTVDAYQRLAELGVLGEDDRVELVAGQVVAMTPIGGPHASCVRRLNDLFAQARLDSAMIDVQNPVVVGRNDAPQPDLVLLKRRADRYPDHPRAADVLLVIEVAESSLAYDRDIKMPLYARAGIPEAWLVNLPAPTPSPCIAGPARATTARALRSNEAACCGRCSFLILQSPRTTSSASEPEPSGGSPG